MNEGQTNTTLLPIRLEKEIIQQWKCYGTICAVPWSDACAAVLKDEIVSSESKDQIRQVIGLS